MSTDVDAVLDHLSELVEQARAVPLSSSCVVNREEVLSLLDDARATLPSALARAERVLRERQALLDGAGAEAEDVLARAHAEQARLVEATAVFTRAQTEADRLLSAAREDAEAMRLQTEDYVDAKLAGFEVVLTTTLATVERGRSRLSGRGGDQGHGGSDGEPDPAESDPAGYDGARYDGARYDGARYDGARYDGARYDGAGSDPAGYVGAGSDGAPSARVPSDGADEGALRRRG